MRVLYFLALIIISSAACTSLENDNNAQQDFPETVETNTSSSDPVIITRSAVPTDSPTVMSTQTLKPPVTDTPQSTFPITATATATSTNVSEPIFLAEIEDAHVWWSEDSQTLYFQDIETREAWAYDVPTGISTTIPYEPHSFRALEPQMEAMLPENATFLSVSPRNQYILYSLPLPEPIPFEENPDLLSYTAELWLRRENQDFNLGLIDGCFGFLALPKWSGNENVVISNTGGAPGIPCQHSVELVDLEALSVGPLLSPWEGGDLYIVYDLSEDGSLLLIRAGSYYVYNRDTNEQSVIPGLGSTRILLVEVGDSLSGLIFDLEFRGTLLRHHVSYIDLSTGNTTPFVTIDGFIIQGIVSPDQKFVVFIASDEFPSGKSYRNARPGIWLLALPSL